jgi:hypothetical protein
LGRFSKSVIIESIEPSDKIFKEMNDRITVQKENRIDYLKIIVEDKVYVQKDERKLLNYK